MSDNIRSDISKSDTNHSDTGKPDPQDGETLVPEAAAGRRGLSTDSWAVLLALAFAALVKLHILNTVRW